MLMPVMFVFDSLAHDAGAFGSTLSRVVKNFGHAQHR